GRDPEAVVVLSLHRVPDAADESQLAARLRPSPRVPDPATLLGAEHELVALAAVEHSGLEASDRQFEPDEVEDGAHGRPDPPRLSRGMIVPQEVVRLETPGPCERRPAVGPRRED